jgi:hypothetical protein
MKLSKVLVPRVIVNMQHQDNRVPHLGNAPWIRRYFVWFGFVIPVGLPVVAYLLSGYLLPVELVPTQFLKSTVNHFLRLSTDNQIIATMHGLEAGQKSEIMTGMILCASYFTFFLSACVFFALGIKCSLISFDARPDGILKGVFASIITILVTYLALSGSEDQPGATRLSRQYFNTDFRFLVYVSMGILNSWAMAAVAYRVGFLSAKFITWISGK